jgi:hypothetical protein
MRSYGGATSQSFEQILAEKESEARYGSFQTRLTACDDQKSRMMYVMLKSPAQPPRMGEGRPSLEP